MPEYSEQVLRMVAQADGQPQETDAPDETPDSYDPGLQQQLEEHGPEALQEFGMIVVRDVGDARRFNSACWYALAHGLRYENRGDTLVITDPTGAFSYGKDQA